MLRTLLKTSVVFRILHSGALVLEEGRNILALKYPFLIVIAAIT